MSSGELGLRLRQLQRSNGGHAPDEGKPIKKKQHSSHPVLTSWTSLIEKFSARRPAVGDVVAFRRFLLRRVRRAGARSEEARELLGKEMTSDPSWVLVVAMETGPLFVHLFNGPLSDVLNNGFYK